MDSISVQKGVRIRTSEGEGSAVFSSWVTIERSDQSERSYQWNLESSFSHDGTTICTTLLQLKKYD